MFCPFMSNSEKKVECSEDCACFSRETQLGRCVLLDISENLSDLSMSMINIPFNEEEDE